MDAASFSSKLILSVLAKDDNAPCPSLMNLSSTPMYRLCRACLSRSASAFSVVHWKTIFLICYLLDYQQVHENTNVSIILLGDKKEPTKWKTNLVQQILLPNNHFSCYFYFKNHFYWRKEKRCVTCLWLQPKPIHKYKFIHLRIYILMDWMNWTNCGAIAQPCHVQYWVVVLFLSASKNSCMISVTFHL